MRKTLLILALIWSFSQVIAQPWLENLPKNKTEYNFYDYQTAFNTYWQPYNLDRSGHYIEEGITKKATGWKQFKRWEYEMESQINPETGEFPTQTPMQVYNSMKQAGGIQSLTSNNSWTSLGPSSSLSGYAGIGRVNCIAFHPTDNNTYWVGTPEGGLWKTSNNGTSWICLTDSNDILGVSSIIIPSNYATSNTIYIATGDRDKLYTSRSIGVLKSTDGGLTWNTTGLNYSLAQNKKVNKLLLDPNDNNTLIAATNNGVYKTTNGGTTWNTLLTSTPFLDMEYKGNSFSTLYGSDVNGDIYRSTNWGSTWTKTLSTTGYRAEISVTDADSTIVYAMIANNTDYGLLGIYKSTNSGLSFTSIYSSTNLMGWNADGSDLGGQGWYDVSIATSPTNSNKVIVGGVNSHRSTNGGTVWTCSNHWSNGTNQPIVHADKHNLVYRSNGDLFECNDGGVYISTDDGLTWTDKSNGLINSQMYKLGVSKTVSTETITGLQDNGSKLLSSGVWSDVKGGDGMECLIDYTDVNIQYGTYTNGQISRTTDHWLNATDIEPSSAGSGAWVTPYIIDPVSHNTLYAGYTDVWKTTDKGTNWTKISIMNTSDKIRSMAISPSNTSILYVADPSKIWKTSNGGTNWTNVTGTLPVTNSSITYIAIKSTDTNTVWITLSGYNSDNVYKTTNGGTSWTNISTGLPNIPITSIVQDTTNTTSEVLYAGTYLGVYYKNGTNNWQEYNSSLPKVRIGELEIYYDANPQNNKLRAATYGRGLWEIGLYSAPSAPLAGFEPENTSICTGDTILFSDLSSNNPTSWNWVFSPGNVAFINGTSASSENPEVKFSTNGYYSVSLTSSNSLGSDTKTINDMVKVGGIVTPFFEDFEASSTTLPNWTLNNPDNLSEWGLISTSGNGSSSQSIYMDYYNNQHQGQRDDLISPILNLSLLSNATLQYKHAYTRFTGSATDSLIIYASNNCGLTWTRLAAYGENGNGNFATAPDATYQQTPAFIPATANDWCGLGSGADCDTIDLSAFAGSANVKIAFQGYDNYSNNLFLDDISISGDSTTNAVANFTVTSLNVCTGISTTFTNTSLNATSYTWKENEVVISNSQNLIKTFTTAGSYTIKLIATDGVTTDSISQVINVISTPTQASTPTGPTSVCTNSSSTSNFSTTSLADATSYIWTMNPSNAGTTNSTTNNATITWSSSYSGVVYVKVKATNTCGDGNASDTVPTSVSAIPANATTPTGSDILCINPNNTSYNTSAITNAITYQWILSPSNAGTISNTGTSALVDWNNAFTGNVTLTVNGSNSCGNGIVSPALNIVINDIPGVTSTPNGPNNLCENNINTDYTISPTTYATTYNWGLTPTSAGSINANGTTATIDWNNQFAGNVDIKVQATNNCGTGPYSNNYSVLIKSGPPKPTLTRSFDTLFSSSSSNNQWYYSNSIISGATNYYYVATNNGSYYVKVTNSSGCSSVSNNLNFYGVGIDNVDKNSSISIFPNPTNGKITVRGEGINKLVVMNIQGQIINEYKNNQKLNDIIIDLSSNSYGVYLIKIITKNGTLLEKVVLE